MNLVSRVALPPERQQDLARRIQDKVLHTDAKMNKADWMTGLAGIAGVTGMEFGLWWADAVAAAVISLDILHDGVCAMRIATAELIDGAPRALEKDVIANDAVELQKALSLRYPEAEVKMRETGRYIRVVVEDAIAAPDDTKTGYWPEGLDRPSRLAEVTYKPR